MSLVTQNITTVFLIVAIVFFGWFIVSDMRAEENPRDPRLQAEYQTREFRSILSDLNSINLDSSLVTDGNFLKMEDVTQEIIDRPVGRPNPFEVVQ